MEIPLFQLWQIEIPLWILANPKLEITFPMFSYILCGNIFHLWKIANPSMEMQNNPLWKKGTFSKERFFEKPNKNHIFYHMENG